MANSVYNSFKKSVMDGTIDMDANDKWVMLVTSAYSPDIDTHTFRSNIAATFEVSGTGYTAGGALIGTPTVTADTTNDRGVFDGYDVSWATSTITARGAVIYKSTGASTTDNLICYVDFGADKSSSAGTFTITWSTVGIMTLS